MLVLTTRGWTGASVVWTHASGSDTFELVGDVHNARDVADELATWLDDPARPWAAAISSVTVTVTTADHRVVLGFSFTGSTPTFLSAVCSAAWQDRFGDLTTGGPVFGSSSVIPATLGWERWDRLQGLRGREGGWRFGHPATSLRRPSCEFVWTQDEAWAVREGWTAAAEPRTAYLWDEAGATWRWVTLGKLVLEHPEDDVLLVVGRLEVLGGE